jgi:hypothetical protein
MATRITEEQKIEMNILYKKYGTYSAVAREMGCAPTTVKKYIIPDFELPQSDNLEKFDLSTLPPFDPEAFKDIDWNNCVIFGDEFKEIQELWKEIVI